MANMSISNFPLSGRGETDRSDPNAAPLEQNVKNLDCGGVPYRIIKEPVLPW